MTFLDKDYKIPVTEGNYFKFVIGENKFRIMSSPIMGWETWLEVDGKRTPKRFKMDENFTGDDIGTDPKHFWAMIVWNFGAKKLQILEITQKGIMKSLRALSSSEDWGDPKGTKGYDIVITREGTTMDDTEYETNPAKPKELDKEIVEAYKESKIKLEALFSNEDPFEDKMSEKDMDEVDKILDGK